MQEEIRRSTRDGTSSKNDDEENCAFTRKEKKGKGKEFQSKGYSTRGENNKNLSKIKFFRYHEIRHYATKCPHNKVDKKPSRGLVGESLASEFELDFTLIYCIVTLMMGSVWYLDSGASFHMTSNK